ncbi:Hypothetical protein EIN_385200, partial [Entamoeba invadens IP1]|jgi:hypothetical protein
VE